MKSSKPWSWIPTLYFAEGLPYVAVMTISVIMYKRLGISNEDIAFYTSWLYLPWVIKPLWGPLVDLFRTKRFWIVAMQFLVGLALAGVAFTLPGSAFFHTTIAVLWLMAFSSATHDIAADGFYMLALDDSQQAFFVGIRSTFYRLAMISGQGAIVILAGYLEAESIFGFGGSIVSAWVVTFFVLAAMFILFFIYHFFVLPRPDSDRSTLGQSTLTPRGGLFLAVFLAGAGLSLVAFYMLLRFVFDLAGMGDPLLTVTSILLTVIGMLILLRNAVAPVIERPEVRNNPDFAAVTGFLSSFVSYATMNKFWLMLSFLLVYRLGESQLVKLVTPFLLDATEKGGLGLSTEQVGFVYGTMGVLGLTLGGLAGGFVVARDGLRYWLWPMVLIIHIPDLMFVYLSAVQPSSVALITAAVTLEQFGYGFGFTAYMMYMIYVSRGASSTSHYALCTGFMALGMMLPGMVSGWIQAQIGYLNFFLWVCLATIPSFILARMLTIEPEFGKKKTA